MRATVMKITEHEIVVLTEDGVYRNLPHPPVLPALGDTIIVPEEKREILPSWSWNIGRVVVVTIVLLAAAGLFLHMQTGWNHDHPTIVAIDINPSLELNIDDDGFVVSVERINDEARTLVGDHELMGQALSPALELLVMRALERGYLWPHDPHRKWVFISVAGPGHDVVEMVKDVFPSDGSIELQLFIAEEKQVDLARQRKLSLNANIIYERAVEQGIQIDEQVLRDAPISVVLERSGVDLERFFHGEATDQPPPEPTYKETEAEPAPEDVKSEPHEEPMSEPEPEPMVGLVPAPAREPVPLSGPAMKPVSEYEEEPSSDPEPAAALEPVYEEEPSDEEDDLQGIEYFELYVRGDDQQLVKVIYQMIEGQPVVTLARYTGEGQVTRGQDALDEVRQLMSYLGLDADVIPSFDLPTEKILDQAGIPVDSWLELILHVKSESGDEMRIRRLPSSEEGR